MRVGDHISFIVCCGEGTPAERSYHPDQVRKDATLRIGALLVAFSF